MKLSLVMALHILTFVFLVACVLFICHLPSVLSYHHMLPNASFLATVMNTRCFCVMINPEKHMRISRNVIFLEHVPFFSLHLDIHHVDVSCFPHFPESLLLHQLLPKSMSGVTRFLLWCVLLLIISKCRLLHLQVLMTLHRYGFPAFFR